MWFVFLLACVNGGPTSPSSSGPASSARKLTIAGSSTVQPVIESAAAAWEKMHPGDTVVVQGGGSGVGISAVRSGLADVGMVSRSLKPEESDLIPTAVARDGIALIVHRDNPMSGIGRDQVVAIYGGAATSWKTLGGGDQPITVVSKEEGRSTLELFAHHFGLTGNIVASAVIIGPNGQAITTTANDPWAISYVSIGSATVAIEQGATIKTLPLDGVAATVENVGNGTYPLSRPLNLVTAAPAAGLAAEFIAFVLSESGQSVVAKEDFIPLSVHPPTAGI